MILKQNIFNILKKDVLYMNCNYKLYNLSLIKEMPMICTCENMFGLNNYSINKPVCPNKLKARPIPSILRSKSKSNLYKNFTEFTYQILAFEKDCKSVEYNKSGKNAWEVIYNLY